ncbi:MAG: ABC transporter permease [Motilibacteraceae bacterium]
MSTSVEARDGRESDFVGEFHVYEPHRTGLPPVRPYIRELWKRRQFAAELSKTGMRAAHSLTVFGQVWLVLNPLLLALVYFVLVNILGNKHYGPDYFAHLTAGLFTFYFVSGCMLTGATSVTSGGKLLLNTAFPRLLMPLSAVRTAFFRFLPTMAVYAVLHVLAGQGFDLNMLMALPFLAMLVVFSAGLAMLFATLQIYFRDTTSFLPYFTRIWLYLSPVLWFPSSVSHRLKPFMAFNPLFSLVGGFSEALVQGNFPPLTMWLQGAFWAVTAFVVGALFFMSKEREFTVRI